MYTKKSTYKNQNILFSHVPKTGGTYISQYLRHYVFPDLPLNFISAERDKGGDWKDWTLGELKELIRSQRQTSCCYATTHYLHPLKGKVQSAEGIFHGESNRFRKEYTHPAGQPKSIFQDFKKNNWFMFSFIRDPRDMICSLYFYGKKNNFSWSKDISLNDFAKEDLFTPIPSYWKEYDFFAEHTAGNFRYFLRKFFKHDYNPNASISEAGKNKSNNLGYQHYCKTGEISEATSNVLNKSSMYENFLEVKNSRLFVKPTFI